MAKHNIVIAAFNRFNYLEKTVESCLASKETDLEIIISDDGSDEEKANRFYDNLGKLDKRIKVIRNKTNEGVGKRFMELHREANGEFIHVIGSDDLLHPQRLATAARELELNKSKDTIWCSRAKFMNFKYEICGLSSTNYDKAFLKVSLFLQPYILHPTISYYNRKISNHKEYRSDMRAAIDYMYYIDNFENADIIFSNKPLTYLVHSSTGITRNKESRKNQLSMHDKAMHEIWSRYTNCSMKQIQIIRKLCVTEEFSSIKGEDINTSMIMDTIDLIRILRDEYSRRVEIESYYKREKDQEMKKKYKEYISLFADSMEKKIYKYRQSYKS